MADLRRVSLDEVVVHFQELKAPRSAVNQRHPLVSALVIALLAVLAGAGGPTAIARRAALNVEFLLRALDLPDGVPRKNVFRRVLMALKPAAFRACFDDGVRSLRTEATGVEQPTLAVDGKTARRSDDRAEGQGALHAVSVWASEYGLSFGEVACPGGSNEITAIPELLGLVDIKSITGRTGVLTCRPGKWVACSTTSVPERQDQRGAAAAAAAAPRHSALLGTRTRPGLRGLGIAQRCAGGQIGESPTHKKCT